jgi:hypothetical protein
MLALFPWQLFCASIFHLVQISNDICYLRKEDMSKDLSSGCLASILTMLNIDYTVVVEYILENTTRNNGMDQQRLIWQD